MIYLLKKKKYKVESQLIFPIMFRELFVDKGFKLNLLVQNLIIVELKAIQEFIPINKAQLFTHLRLMKKRKGILINFHCSNIFYEGQILLLQKNIRNYL